MKFFVLAVAVLLSIVVTTLPVHATGAETTHFKFKGQFAEAVFHTVDSAGCIETFVYVFAQVDQRERTSEAVVEIFQEDNCSGTLLVSGFGSATLAPNQFNIDKDLDAATLDATVEVTDFVSTNTFPVDVSVSWTGSGETFKVTDTFHLKEPGFKRNAYFNGNLRNATASGTLSAGTIDFTSQPAMFADMGSVQQGAVTITY